MEGTRQEIIGKIVEWIDGGDDKPVCWLQGAPGSGKSAISKTISETYAAKNRLGGSFFFLRGAGRRSKISRLISTLAYNLALHDTAIGACIKNVLGNDPAVRRRSMKHQVQKLIVEPIQLAANSRLPLVFVVDALDACGDRTMIAEFVAIVAGAFRDHRHRFRFLFTSRGKEHIRNRFTTDPVNIATCFLDLKDFNADADLRTFYRSHFSVIYEDNRRRMRDVTLPWPSESDLDKLVQRSSGSFTFASTLIESINNGTGLPHTLLQEYLESDGDLDMDVNHDDPPPFPSRTRVTVTTVGGHRSRTRVQRGATRREANNVQRFVENMESMGGRMERMGERMERMSREMVSDDSEHSTDDSASTVSDHHYHHYHHYRGGEQSEGSCVIQ
jgi:hypothetical protein